MDLIAQPSGEYLGKVDLKSVMKSADDRPSVWDIRTCLLSSLDFAEEFAQHQSKHVDAVTRFSQDIRRIKKELMDSFAENVAVAPLHDIVTGLTGARTMVSIMVERHPEKRDLLMRFEESLKHVQEEFIRKVRPELSELYRREKRKRRGI